MGQRREVLHVTILNGAALSEAFQVDRGRIVGIVMPTAWTAGSITFAALLGDGATYGKVMDDGGNEVTLTSPAASTVISITPPKQVQAGGMMKVRSGTNGTPVNQGANRAIGVIVAFDE